MRRYPLILLFIFIGLAFLSIWYLSEIVIYFIISLVLTVFLNPIVDKINDIYLMGIQIPRWTGAIISFVVLGLFGWILFLIILPLVSDQFTVLKSVSLENITPIISPYLQKVEDYLIRHFIPGSKSGFILKSMTDNLYNLFKSSNFNDLINNLLSFGGSILTGIIAVFFITFFLLKEPGILKNALLSLVPRKYFEMSIALYSKLEIILSGYLRGIIIQSTAIAFVTAISLLVIGIEDGIIIGILTGSLNLIPYIGPLISYILGLFIAVATESIGNPEPEYFSVFLKLSVVFIAIQAVDFFFFRPFIFSRALKLHALEILIIIIIGAKLGGAIGMVMALPAYSILKVSIEEFIKAYNQYRVFKQ
ncbi:MAG: hypothetical protein A3G23_04295 [Bacteroidetes bacterium RIFCSPLOWO2_12_FULL_37_12]|nr:MAG: hypothetical protein A3G23_04295 [Bacteroidetes bacterium RIFCSPLOWO2_12_FULL_37_12]